MKYFKMGNNASGVGNKKPVGNTPFDMYGAQSKVVVPNGYYRYQPDEQPVLERSGAQQRIVDEFFIIQNWKTTTCDPSLKTTAKTFNVLKVLAWIIGAFLSVISIIREGFEMEPLLVCGLIFLAMGVIFWILYKVYRKRFEQSIKHVTEPKRVLSNEEYMELVRQRIEAMDVVSLGMERLGIDPEQVKEVSPIILTDKVVADMSLRYFDNATATLYSSTHHVTLLYFTDEELFVYKLQFDMCCDKQEEWASEFFYQDICDVSSYVVRNIVNEGSYRYEYSAVSFEVIASNSKIGFTIDGDNENISSIQAMKQKVRARKERS